MQPPSPSGPSPIPERVSEYAAACVTYVSAALQVALDFEPETLPLLDHYLRQSRSSTQHRPESLPLLAAVAGCYIGEVVRRRHPCHWFAASDDPSEWSLEFDEIPLTVFPIAIASQAINGPQPEEEAIFELPPKYRTAVQQRLDVIPQVSVDDYFAPSTRVEVIDIVIDEVTTQRLCEKTETPSDAN